MEVTVKIINAKENKENLYLLWESVLGNIWPVDRQIFDNTVFSENSLNFIVKDGGETIGFLSSQIVDRKASIVCLLVKRVYQRRDIGTELVKELLQYCKTKKIKYVSLGSGGKSYFWPGVPTNLEVAISFFKKLGWTYSGTSVDMIGQLTDYQTPDGIFQMIEDLGIKLDFAKKDQVEKLDKFERENFPDWYGYFSEAIKENKLNNILLAVSVNNQILGSVLIDRDKKAWNRILGGKAGVLGALGVSENVRGWGIGLALAAKGTEILKENDLEVCFLSWTWLIDWYGKLGYKVWREYQMSTKNT